MDMEDVDKDTKKWMQKALSKVAKALLKQGKKSYDKDKNACLYFGPNNTRCAVGHLLPASAKEEALSKGWNMDGVCAIPHNYYPFVFGCAPLTDCCSDRQEFLMDIQSIHDETKPSRWRQKLNVFARKHGLKITW